MYMGLHITWLQSTCIPIIPVYIPSISGAKQDMNISIIHCQRIPRTDLSDEPRAAICCEQNHPRTQRLFQDKPPFIASSCKLCRSLQRRKDDAWTRPSRGHRGSCDERIPTLHCATCLESREITLRYLHAGVWVSRGRERGKRGRAREVIIMRVYTASRCWGVDCRLVFS